jgi:hypothetical protein
MPSSQEGLNELAVLMELRLAFGPGTRLWSHRSREEICYDWLHFKARKVDACFRDFALRLYLAEKRQSLPGVSLHEIRRRVANVLKAYRIKKRAAIARVPTTTPPVRSDRGRAPSTPTRPLTTATTQILASPAALPNLNRFSLRSKEVPR